MFYALIIIAVLMVILELYAAGKNFDYFLKSDATSFWAKCYRWRWALGIPFAALPFFISYPIPAADQTYHVIGFPLAIAATDEAGLSYVGKLSTPFMISDMLIWYFFPQILLLVTASRKKKYQV